MLTSITHPATHIPPARLPRLQQDIHDVGPRRVARRALLQDLVQPAKSAPAVLDTSSSDCLKSATMLAYGSAISFCATHTEAHALTCASVRGDWVANCRLVQGPSAPFLAACATIAFVRCYELLRHVWQQPLPAVLPWVRSVLLPHLAAPSSALLWDLSCASSHWHAALVEARLQLALASDDLMDANWCVVQHQQLVQTYIKDNGLTTESVRSSDHASYGLVSLVQTAELLANQGLESGYSLRLFRALEAHAALFAGRVCPAGYSIQQFNILSWLQPCAWEVALGRYEAEGRGIGMPNVRMLLQRRLRPCGFHMYFGYDTATHANPT